MGFRTNVVDKEQATVSLEDCGDGFVSVMVGETSIITFCDDGTLELSEYVDPEEVANLKLTEGKDTGWGDLNRRARIFFMGEEFVLPSEQKVAETSKVKRSKKADKVLA